MASSLGSLVVSLAANTAEFQRDLGKAAHEADKKMKDIGDAAEKAGKVVATAFAAAVASIAFFTRSALESADAMGKLAQGAGVSTETMSELAFVFDRSGVKGEQLASALAQLNANIADTAAGTGEAREAFKALGIEVTTGSGTLKDVDTIIREIAEKFEQFKDGAEKSALAGEIFGRRIGTKMVDALNQGAAGFDRAIGKARDFSITVSGETARAAAEFNDKMGDLNKALFDGFFKTVAEFLLPALNDLTDALTESARKGEQFYAAFQAVQILFETLAITTANVAFVFKVLGMEIGGFAAKMEALSRFDIETMTVIRDAVAADAAKARAELDAFEKYVFGLKDRLKDANLGDIEFDRDDERPSAPRVRNREQMAGEQQRIKEAAKAQQDFLDLMAKAALKRQEMEDEAERRATEAFERETERRQLNIDNLTESLLTEEERELESYERRAQMIQDALDRGLIMQEEAQDIAEKLAEKHEKRMSDIKKRSLTDLEKFNAMSWQKQTQTVIGELVELTAGVAQHNRTLFNINKAAAIAEAVINAYLGISKTLASYPFPYNIALAAVHAAVAFAQVSSIASTSFQSGGRGAAPSLAGATAAQPVTPVDAGGRPLQNTTQDQAPRPIEITLVLTGGRASTRAAVEEIMEEMAELTKDGSPVRFTQKTVA